MTSPICSVCKKLLIDRIEDKSKTWTECDNCHSLLCLVCTYPAPERERDLCETCYAQEVWDIEYRERVQRGED